MTRILNRLALRKMALAALIGAVLLLSLAACGGGEKQVTGMVLDAVERSLTHAALNLPDASKELRTARILCPFR